VILVAVGSSQFPFDRLLRAVADLPSDERVVVQHGPSQIRPLHASCLDFAPLDVLGGLIREARVVVTHAGVGSVLFALANGKRPVVVPRRRAFGETVDDHQVESARRFAGSGIVTLVEEPELLAATLAATPAHEFELSLPSASLRLPLVEELRGYLGTVLGPPSRAVTP
jgi:UDP-N-acetylglucosamine transferase subunit ALG13